MNVKNVNNTGITDYQDNRNIYLKKYVFYGFSKKIKKKRFFQHIIYHYPFNKHEIIEENNEILKFLCGNNIRK